MASNTSHPFFDPLWRRIILVAACAVWFALEMLYGTQLWQMLVGAVTVYGAYAYLYNYTPSVSQKDET